MNARPQAPLLQSENDLQRASLALDHGIFSQACYHASQACYHASQAAEKALKSLVVDLGAEPPHAPIFFARADAQQAISIAEAVIRAAASLDRPGG